MVRAWDDDETIGQCSSPDMSKEGEGSTGSNGPLSFWWCEALFVSTVVVIDAFYCLFFPLLVLGRPFVDALEVAP